MKKSIFYHEHDLKLLYFDKFTLTMLFLNVTLIPLTGNQPCGCTDVNQLKLVLHLFRLLCNNNNSIKFKSVIIFGFPLGAASGTEITQCSFQETH